MAIIERQNEQSTLDKLTAQRKLYDMAKKLRTLRFVLCVVIIVCLSIARLILSECHEIESALIIVTTMALISEPILERYIDKYRTLAAQIQQRLDNELYGFEWDDCVCGKEPSDELVCDYKEAIINEKLYNWYDVNIGNVQDENVAVLLCQRENISYDSGLREWYVTLNAWTAAILIFIVVYLSFAEGWDLMTVLVFGVIPAIPIAEWFISIFKDNSVDKEHLESLELLVMKETNKVLAGRDVTKKTLMKIQNLLYLHRKSGFLIPNWFYHFKRKKSERRSAYSVQEFLKKYNN